MKFLLGPLAMLRQNRSHERNLRVFFRFSAALAILIVVFMVVFRVLMVREGVETTWTTALYWVLTVMSTLGFGDITFDGDQGRLFSIVVLLSGMFLLLVLLPFLFIELFYIPWSNAQNASRTPRQVRADLSGHVLITNVDVTVEAMRQRLERLERPCVLVLDDAEQALRYYDQGWHVLLGEHDLPETWRKAGVERAALVAATGSDAHNAHVAFTVREVDADVPVIGIAHDPDSVDVLELAGCTEVLELPERMGETLARRVSGIDVVSHTIGKLDDLVIAEANARNTQLPGKTLREANLRVRIGVSVVGLWEHGSFNPADANLTIHEDSVLLLAGTREQIDRYDRESRKPGQAEKPILILGGGRVGRATARALAAAGLDYRIVEKVKGRIRGDERVIVGNAADRRVLEQAGLDETPTVILTTHDDDMNVFLTLYCRRLRPEVQILSRATRARNVPTLHRAGADFVLSYATMGANAICDHLDNSEVVTIAEGLFLFRFDTPLCLHGKSLAEMQLRALTGASVVAFETEHGRSINPDPNAPLPGDSKLVLIGDAESEALFVEHFVRPS